LNPARNETYSLIDGLLGEVSTLFPDNYLHLGGVNKNKKIISNYKIK
jgi:N-acetyl-beta-hexosaminidase